VLSTISYPTNMRLPFPSSSFITLTLDEVAILKVPFSELTTKKDLGGGERGGRMFLWTTDTMNAKWIFVHWNPVFC
jgi:hypothetical protein